MQTTDDILRSSRLEADLAERRQGRPGTEMSRKHMAECACGAIAFGFDTDPEFVANCYCLDCRKATGGIMATVLGVPETDLKIIRGWPRSFRYVAASGRTLNRNFCPDCGARLFTSGLEGMPGMILVQFGSLQAPDDVTPRFEMFTNRRPTWACRLEAPQFDGMPPP